MVPVMACQLFMFFCVRVNKEHFPLLGTEDQFRKEHNFPLNSVFMKLGGNHSVFMKFGAQGISTQILDQQPSKIRLHATCKTSNCFIKLKVNSREGALAELVKREVGGVPNQLQRCGCQKASGAKNSKFFPYISLSQYLT